MTPRARPLAILAFCLAALATAACTTAANTPDPTSTAGEWRLIAGTDVDGAVIEVPSPAPTVVIADRTPQLFRQCVTPKEMQTGTKSEQPLPACDSEPQSAIADAVDASSTATRDGITLVLTGDDPDLHLQFYPVPGISAADLEGTWTSTAAPGFKDSPVTLKFAPDGTVTGGLGCTAVTARLTTGTESASLADVDVATMGGGTDFCRFEEPSPLEVAIAKPVVFHFDAQRHLQVVPEHGAAFEFARTGTLGLDDIGGEWSLTFGQDGTGEFASAEPLTLTITDDHIAGGYSCESWVALTVDQRKEARESAQNLLPILARTTAVRGGCADTGPLSERYVTALAAVSSAVIDDTDLVLVGDGVNLRFDLVNSEPGK